MLEDIYIIWRDLVILLLYVTQLILLSLFLSTQIYGEYYALCSHYNLFEDKARRRLIIYIFGDKENYEIDSKLKRKEIQWYIYGILFLVVFVAFIVLLLFGHHNTLLEIIYLIGSTVLIIILDILDFNLHYRKVERMINSMEYEELIYNEYERLALPRLIYFCGSVIVAIILFAVLEDYFGEILGIVMSIYFMFIGIFGAFVKMMFLKLPIAMYGELVVPINILIAVISFGTLVYQLLTL
ncbi:hypothetical protein [Vallitalea maricola]|uniref:Uncharacterized protein n=1 Tax=Vallitalea maricola TaxID=3074433 RepID=A0ACB5URL4_9FIRM|nr:hypothetical protein AN2V17_38560 [Vallitalea sp. AN17-2]